MQLAAVQCLMAGAVPQPLARMWQRPRERHQARRRSCEFFGALLQSTTPQCLALTLHGAMVPAAGSATHRPQKLKSAPMTGQGLPVCTLIVRRSLQVKNTALHKPTGTNACGTQLGYASFRAGVAQP